MDAIFIPLIISLLFLLYFYYLFACGKLYEGRTKNLVFLFLAVFLLGISLPFRLLLLGTAALLLLSFLFFLFYSRLLVREFWWRLLLPDAFLLGGIYCLCYQTERNAVSLLILNGMLFLIFAILSYLRGYLRNSNLILTALLLGALSGAGFFPSWFPLPETAAASFSTLWSFLLLFLSLLVFLLLEGNLQYYESGYRKTTKTMQEEMMQHQFGELRDIYLNMRGWRHDYHNHIQVLKAQLDSNQIREARSYLNQIEHELDKVDTFVKSGNMMADAILNSKLTLAMQRDIQVTCEAYLPNELFLPDAELCTLLGNILDNAIEGCERVPTEKRFLRIYLAMVKEQFYLSVQNSSEESGSLTGQLFQNQKQYISTKRGNHGLGLKRVAAVAERFHGYLNLSREEGVFGTEVTIPKP